MLAAVIFVMFFNIYRYRNSPKGKSMTPLFQKLPQEKQAKILDAAISVFAERGYYDANVQSICEKADIATGSLYRYFGNKENLCICAYNHVIEVMFEVVYGVEKSEEKLVFDVIREMLLNTQKFYRELPNVSLFYSNIWATSMNHFVPMLSLEIEESIDIFWIKLIKRGQENGEIDTLFPPECVAYLIDSQTLLYSFSLGSSYHAKRLESFLNPKGHEQTPEEVIDKIVNTLQLSLAPR